MREKTGPELAHEQMGRVEGLGYQWKRCRGGHDLCWLRRRRWWFGEDGLNMQRSGSRRIVDIWPVDSGRTTGSDALERLFGMRPRSVNGRQNTHQLLPSSLSPPNALLWRNISVSLRRSDGNAQRMKASRDVGCVGLTVFLSIPSIVRTCVVALTSVHWWQRAQDRILPRIWTSLLGDVIIRGQIVAPSAILLDADEYLVWIRVHQRSPL